MLVTSPTGQGMRYCIGLRFIPIPYSGGVSRKPCYGSRSSPPAISVARGCMESNRSIQAAAFEQHFSPAQLAEMWGLSSDFIRDQFFDEPGVLRINRPETMHKRRYC